MAYPMVGALVLAAGKGTRMHSRRPKVLQTLLGESMLRLVASTLRPLVQKNLWFVVGHMADMVVSHMESLPQAPYRYIRQTEQLGTGHALQCAWNELAGAGIEYLLVANGDVPLLEEQEAKGFLEEGINGEVDLSFMTLTLKDPGAFGRVIRKNGKVAAIMEAKDYDPMKHGESKGEINAGIYLLRVKTIAPLLSRLQNTNKSGEYYITDLVSLAVEAGLRVSGIDQGDRPGLLGVNSPAELVLAEEYLRESVVARLQKQGVVIRAPQSARISPFAKIEPGADICGPVEIYGESRVASGVLIESYCKIIESVIEPTAEIRSFSHLEKAHVREGALIGPYARLRPGAAVLENAHVGNFVELKKTTLGKDSKANHLAYLGDATIGEGVNIGAGTITCNYDGINKFATRIEDGAFIGSNSSLVAPVRIGKKSIVGAGSVITDDVPDKGLALGRSRQINKDKKNKE